MLFRRKTYARIVKGLTGLVDDLREHAEGHLSEAQAHRREAEAHASEALRKEEIAARSQGTADKIAALLG